MSKFTSPTNYTCEKCNKRVPAYYTLSLLTKGLWVQCKDCGTHARPFVPDLPLFERPSKHYLKHMKQVGFDSSVPVPNKY